MTFTSEELTYLESQPLGRLATVAPSGALHNNPVGFRVNDDGTIDIHGMRLGESAKFRNVQRHREVSFVVDDLASTNPWMPRCLEVRGWAEALSGVETVNAHFSAEAIRVHPTKLVSFGINTVQEFPTVREVA